MIGRKKKDSSQRIEPGRIDSNLAVGRRNGSAGPSILSQDTRIIGTLESTGEVQIDGQIEGDARCKVLIAGEKATINGDIIADDVIIRGHLKGNIRARKVELSETAHVVGDIFHKILIVRLGAFIDGSCLHTDEPMASEKPKPTQTPKHDTRANIEKPPAPSLALRATSKFRR